jgi:hypothetical protein
MHATRSRAIFHILPNRQAYLLERERYAQNQGAGRQAQCAMEGSLQMMTGIGRAIVAGIALILFSLWAVKS